MDSGTGAFSGFVHPHPAILTAVARIAMRHLRRFVRLMFIEVSVGCRQRVAADWVHSARGTGEKLDRFLTFYRTTK